MSRPSCSTKSQLQ